MQSLSVSQSFSFWTFSPIQLIDELLELVSVLPKHAKNPPFSGEAMIPVFTEIDTLH